MPVRTAYVGTEAVGDVLTKANFDKLPGGWIGYAEAVANQGAITAEVDLTSLTVTVTVNTSRRLRISALGLLQSTVASDVVRIFIYEDGASIQLADEHAGGQTTVTPSVIRTPTAGSHTYKLRGQRAVGTGTVTLLASASNPAYILVEDIGPAT